MHRTTVRILAVLLVIGLASSSAFGLTKKKTKVPVKRKAHAVMHAAVTKVRFTPASYTVPAQAIATTHLRPVTRKRAVWSPWTEPTFADSTAGDRVDGEDLLVRRAAVQALGPYNGTVVVADPTNGRILAIVNQNLAFKSGFQPCSTIKIVAALGGLNEGVIEPNKPLAIGRRTRMDLSEALARSNNSYFATVGARLGFEKISQYAKMVGLGEKACLNCDEERPGTIPDELPPEGAGMMTVFGSGINLTPLQLAAVVSAVANGGTLYYLQHPKTQDEVDHFQPKIKRQLDVAHWIPELKPGMEGAVEYGTARRALNENETIFGKTGTCSDVRSPGVHLGWFGSFTEVGDKKVAVVVLLTGGRPVNGPFASGIAGAVYRNLSDEGYFNHQKVATASAQTAAIQNY